MRSLTIRQLLGAGFFGMLLLVGIGTATSVRVTRQAQVAVERADRLAAQGYRLARVAGLVREFYIHQAHLALGLHAGHHRGMARTARDDLGAAIDALGDGSVIDLESLRTDVAALDRLFEQEFLPALERGDAATAAAVHHRAVEQVDALVARLEVGHQAATDQIRASRASAREAADGLLYGSAAALLVIGLIALVFIALMARTIAGPTRRLTAAAARLAAGGEERVPVDGPAELRTLGQALNDMLAALERQRDARSAAETMAALGRASAGIAHEINNPLGVILGHARLIERAGGAAAEDAQVIASEARLCQRIVQALLDYARPGVLTRAAVDLRALLETLAERHGAQLDAPADVQVSGDHARLQQLFSNLLQNAAAFGEVVTVRATVAADGVRVQVDDDGPGVAADRLDAIFEPFDTSRADGVGLGLAIARSIAEAHGGTLRATAGPGGHFDVHLPGEPDGAHPDR